MYQETDVPIKKKASFTERDSLEKSKSKEIKDLDPVYEKELLPLIKIFLPKDEDLDVFAADVTTELKNQAEKIQDIENRALISPEESIKEMRAILVEKAKAIIADFDNEDWKTRRAGKGMSPDFYKKAKICLLRAGDFSHWNKYYSNKPDNDPRENSENISEDSLGYYLDINRFSSSDNAIRLNALETEALLEVGFEKQLIKIASSRSSSSFSEISDTLLQKMIKAKEEKTISSIDFETCLERIPPSGGYSSQTMEHIARLGSGGYVFSHPKAFADNDKPEFWEKLNKLNSPEYPYHLSDALKGVIESNLDAGGAKAAIASAFRHNFTDFNNFDEHIKDEALRREYEELSQLSFLKYPSGYEFIPPDELDEKGMRQMRKMIEDGNLGMLYGHRMRKYIDYLADNDYKWLRGNIEKYEQENMLLSVKVLRPADQSRYAEKLLAEGNEEILRRMIEHGSFSNNSLSKEIFWDLTKDGRSVSPHYFSGLDSSCLQKFISKFDSGKSGNILDRDMAIRKNIKFFDLQEGVIENKEKFVAYQELLKNINTVFGDNTPSDNLYNALRIDFRNFKSPEEIKQKQDDLVSKLLVIKEVIGNRNLSSVFSGGLNINILNQDIESLREDADSLKHLLNYMAQTSVDNLEVMRGLTPIEKERAGHLLGINSLPLNKLIERIKQSGSSDEELNDVLARDFAVDVTKFEDGDKSDFSKMLGAVRDSWSEKYARETEYKGNVKIARDAALLGKRYPADNDRFIRIARDYQAKGSLSNDLHEFNFNSFSDELGPEFNQDNWAGALAAYVLAMEEDEWKVPDDKKGIIEAEFSGPYRDVCLKSMSSEWREFLGDEEQEELPLKLLTLSETIDNYGGVGSLSRIEALAGLMHSFNAASENKKVVPRTLSEIKSLLSKQEDRFEKENWSQDDKAEFHNLAKEMIEAAPSLFSAFAPIFEKLSPKETKIFLKEMMPLYHINLITIQSAPNQEGDVSYEARDLVSVRSSIRRLADSMQMGAEHRERALQLEKDRLTSTMRANFRDSMGLENVPNQIDKEGLRMLHNFIRYTGNINDRDADKEAIISFFLALNINGDWEKFRKGEEIDPRNYLSENKAGLLKEVMAEREKNKLTADMVGLAKSQLSDFQDKLQAETRNSMIGNVETIDVKLGILKRNVDDLLDPDAYEDQADKSLLEILTKYHKATGSSLAKIFQKLNGRSVTMSQDEELAAKELAVAFEIKEWSQDKVKEIQERMQPISLINNMAKKLEDSGLEENVQELNRFLNPKKEVIEIFNKLDENFKTGSGAIAISKDLEYLDNLLIKERSKINEEEVEIASNYLNAIREKMSTLEKMMYGAREYFNKLKSSVHSSGHQNQLLVNRLKDIEKIMNNREHDALISTEMTKDFSLIIENMRQCLGCLRKEANNDTNLAFGDYNKFFLVSKRDKAKGSIADEIVFLLPVSKEDGTKNMSFVMDRVYGTASPDILMAHFLTIYKKFNSLKTNFKDAKLSISITQEALSSAGVSAEIFKARIIEKMPDAKIIFSESQLSTVVPSSSFSDNYIEFGTGNSARSAGRRDFKALLIE